MITLHYCLECGVVVAFDLYYFGKHDAPGVEKRFCPVCKTQGQFLVVPEKEKEE